MMKTTSRPWWWPKRPPDAMIGEEDDPYMLRWHVIPRNRWMNIYLHEFHRSDDDRALHDHPWDFVSLVLYGSYIEMGLRKTRPRRTWSVGLRIAEHLHRVVVAGVCRTLVITGPTRREWGFVETTGWVRWWLA